MKYQIVDNETGQKYIFEGDTPPTEADIEEYLSQQKPQGFQDNPVYKAINTLTWGLPQGAIESFNRLGSGQNPYMPKPITSDMSVKQKLSTVGQAVNPVNLFMGALHDLGPAMAPAGATAATYYGIPMLIKSILPYLTYNGINQLKDKLANQDPNAFQGKDVQGSLVDKLTAGNKLGNVSSDVEKYVNDILTRRMPGGFSNTNTYNAGDINQLGKNIGQAEQGGYDYNTVPGMIRSAATTLVKDIVPQTKFPYYASNFLQGISKTRGVGGLLKNPVTWPVVAAGVKTVPWAIKTIFNL